MDILEIAKKIEKIGGSTYLVGGALRDELIGRKIKDRDYCVVGITGEEFQKLFPEAYIRGKAFEVFDLYGNEFAMARKELKSGVGHKAFNVKTSPTITIEEDLARRDITINSIAKNVLTGEIIDPYNGKEDIKNKIIRATTNKFKEDPLRVYRVARFATMLEFEIEENTIKLMNSLKNELMELSAERVFNELKLALMQSKPSIFFRVLNKANVLDIHFKEIYDLIGALQPEKYHPEGDAFEHTMHALDVSAMLTNRLEVRYATLVHDLGKGTTPKMEYPHHYGHEQRGIELVGKLSNRIKAPTAWRKCGKSACAEHTKGGIFFQMKASTQVDFIERVSKSILGLDGLQIVVYSDGMSKELYNNKIQYIENIKERDTNEVYSERISTIKKKNGESFEEIGKKCIQEVTGEMIAKKYKLSPGIELGKRLREERINYLKEKLKTKR